MSRDIDAQLDHHLIKQDVQGHAQLDHHLIKQDVQGHAQLDHHLIKQDVQGHAQLDHHLIKQDVQGHAQLDHHLIKQDVQGHWRPAVLVNVRVPQATVKTWLQHLRYNNNIYSIRWSINLPGPGHHISFITANNSVNNGIYNIMS